MAFLDFVLSSRVAAACSSKRALGGGDIRPLLVIRGVEVVSRFRQALSTELVGFSYHLVPR
jgi:hypothetical protein